ncbi:hypothetical protein [Actinoplanes sp. NPDC049802]|uniref:hypothetical protein n=1 Tax=Actinoplanes sp. NPDC049802 TaxID=3154742 RepID=UPI0033E267AD
MNTQPERGVMSDPRTEGELSNTLDPQTDTEELRNGGPAGEGILTTTGGTAGPASFPHRPRTGPGVANPTTGDATTGDMDV